MYRSTEIEHKRIFKNIYTAEICEVKARELLCMLWHNDGNKIGNDLKEENHLTSHFVSIYICTSKHRHTHNNI